MGEVIQFPTKYRTPEQERQAFIREYVTDDDRKFMEQNGLDFERCGEHYYILVGHPFILPSGTKVAKSYGYLKPCCGRYQIRNGKEYIEVACVKTRRVNYVPINILEPLRLIDDLGVLK